MQRNIHRLTNVYIQFYVSGAKKVWSNDLEKLIPYLKNEKNITK